jgi:hypothetical protein
MPRSKRQIKAPNKLEDGPDYVTLPKVTRASRTTRSRSKQSSTNDVQQTPEDPEGLESRPEVDTEPESESSNIVSDYTNSCRGG